MSLQIFINKLLNFKSFNFQLIIAILIPLIFTTRYEYAIQFVTGQLEYKWNFATITSQDVKLASILLITGMLTWYFVGKVKGKIKRWRKP